MSRRPRLVELAPRVLVRTSDVYMTTTTVVAAGSRCLLIDPALLPGELAALEEELAELGLAVEAAVSTHPHWDHVLWSAGLGDAPRFASARAIETLERRRGPMVDDQIMEASRSMNRDIFDAAIGAAASFRQGLAMLTRYALAYSIEVVLHQLAITEKQSGTFDRRSVAPTWKRRCGRFDRFIHMLLGAKRYFGNHLTAGLVYRLNRFA